MLALTRKVGESISIDLPTGETIVVTFVEQRSWKNIRIGVVAPQFCKIYRTEVAHIHLEKK